MIKSVSRALRQIESSDSLVPANLVLELVIDRHLIRGIDPEIQPSEQMSITDRRLDIFAQRSFGRKSVDHGTVIVEIGSGRQEKSKLAAQGAVDFRFRNRTLAKRLDRGKCIPSLDCRIPDQRGDATFITMMVSAPRCHF